MVFKYNNMNSNKVKYLHLCTLASIWIQYFTNNINNVDFLIIKHRPMADEIISIFLSHSQQFLPLRVDISLKMALRVNYGS